MLALLCTVALLSNLSRLSNLGNLGNGATPATAGSSIHSVTRSLLDLAGPPPPPPTANGPAPACENIHSQVGECAFVRAYCDPGDGYIDYLRMYYCSFSHTRPLAVTLMLAWLGFLFIFLGISADNALCPALKVVADGLHLSDNVAGVTFLALGNGAPDLSSAYVALQRESTANIAFGALSGAGLFVTTVVLAAVSFAGEFTVTRRPFLRDITVYLIAALWFLVMLWDSVIHVWEAIGFVVLYLIYVVIVIVGHQVYARRKSRRSTLFSSLLAVPGAPILGASISHGVFDTAIEGAESEAKEELLDERVQRIREGRERAEDPEALAASHVAPHVARYAAQLTVHGGSAPSTSYGALHSSTGSPAALHSDPAVQALMSSVAVVEGGDLDDDDVDEGVWESRLGSRALFGSLVEAWRTASWGGRLLSLTSLTAETLLRLTVPMVEDGEWSFWGCVLTPTTACVFAFVAFGGLAGLTASLGPVPLIILPLVFGLCWSVAVFVLQRQTPGRARYRTLFALLAFVSSVAWISVIANELVDLLAAFGTIVGISDAMLGISVLAWGNSLGDLVADYAVAKGGMAQMAIGAVFSSPMLNLLIGVGASLTVKISRDGRPFVVDLNGSIATAVIALIVSLLSSTILIPTNGFSADRRYGFYLIALYLIAFTGAVIFEFE